jgi:hypothetical protein
MPLCTCGCLANVTNATKINHLKGIGKATLRTRVAAENEWLTQSTIQPSKKRSRSTSDQNYSQTRRKAAQVEVDEGPAIIPADAYPMELGPEPAFDQIHSDPGDALPEPEADMALHQERLNRIVDERWGNGILGGGEEEEEEEEAEEEEEEAEKEEEEEEEEDEDDSALFAESGVRGISDWEMLREGFEREAASIGLFTFTILLHVLTIIQAERPLVKLTSPFSELILSKYKIISRIEPSNNFQRFTQTPPTTP